MGSNRVNCRGRNSNTVDIFLLLASSQIFHPHVSSYRWVYLTKEKAAAAAAADICHPVS